MAKKLRFISDPALAKPHEAGAVVELIQPVLHLQFGAIHYLSPKMYPYHFHEANVAFEKLETFQEKILECPIGTDNGRMITDFDFIGDIYRYGFDAIVHTHLAFDHLALDILMIAYQDNTEQRKVWNHSEMLRRVHHVIKKILNRADILGTKEYAALAEIEQRRNAFNHPTSRRTYNGDAGTWDEVPLAWIISGKYKDVYLGATKLFEQLYELWDAEKGKYDRPGTITGQRGIRSLDPAKKPKRA